MKKLGLYEWSIILFFIVVPLGAIGAEILLFGFSFSLSELALKWFVFSGIGLRLGGAGIKQVFQPQFTAKEIFKVEDRGALPLVRELGLANICFSVIAITSLFVPSFRIPASVAGGLYFGFAGLLHVTKPKESSEEVFAMVSDLVIFLVLVVLVIINLFAL